MTQRWTILLTAFLLAAGLAGCIGGADEPGGAQPAGQGNDTDDPALQASGTTEPGDRGRAALSYTLEEPLDRTVWANGTFQPQNNCYAGGCAIGSAAQRTVLTSELPQGVPVQVRAGLTYDRPAPVFAEPVNLALFSEDATFYTYDVSRSEGQAVIETTVLKASAPLIAEVFYNWPTGGEPEVSYTLRIDITADPTLVPAGVPVAVTLGPGETLELERVGEGGSPSVLLYGPNDALIQRASADGERLETTVPEYGRAGEYVLVMPAEGPDVRIQANTTSQEMRPLPLSFEPGEARTIQGSQTVEWTFDTQGVPLAVGAYYTQTGPAGVSATQGSVTLVGPQGALLESSFGCGICLTIGFGRGTGVPIGDPGLAAGTYSVTYEPGAEAGFSVGHYVVGYQR